MIISASRRTDIPAFFSDWFFDRIDEGFISVRNPRNPGQVREIDLSPDAVDGIVFWTKNPAPMLGRLDRLKDYMYYFQFTITPYGKDIEPGVLKKTTAIVATFKQISEMIGADRVILRYDPILINDKYTSDYHVIVFDKILQELHNYTKKVTISFIDTSYKGVIRNTQKLRLESLTEAAEIKLAATLAKTAHKYGLQIETCAEKLDLHRYGIGRARCIDSELFSKLLGKHLIVRKDAGQRPECGCATSVDIGTYNTCSHHCLYCYANYNKSPSMF